MHGKFAQKHTMLMQFLSLKILCKLWLQLDISGGETFWYKITCVVDAALMTPV